MPGLSSIWRISDGRRGHDNQTLGLTDALARRIPIAVTEVHVDSGLGGAFAALRHTAGGDPPRLVLGAGHATHLALLLCARRHRARSVVLMNPSLPRPLFDLCVLPMHDGVAERGNVLLSLGALNRVLPARDRDPTLGLILVGGPSRHHDWDPQDLLAQIDAIVAREPGQHWFAAGSPRTPAATLALLERVPQVSSVAFENTTAQWLAEHIARAARVWVTQDSVSMAFEAASSGAATGVLHVPARRHGRVHAAVNSLIRSGHATSFAAWRDGATLAAGDPPLQEAARCADALLARWPDLAA